VLAQAAISFGELGPTMFRSVTTAGALLALFLAVGLHRPTTSRRPSRRWGPLLPFCCGAWVLIGFSQERPQQVSLLLLPAAGWLCARLLGSDWLPALSSYRYLSLLAGLAAIGVVWVNCHQGVLVGAGAVTVSALAHRRGWRKRLGLIAVTAAATCVSPAGPAIWLAPGRLATAAGTLAEWQPVPLWAVPAWGSALLTLGFVGVWIRGGHRPTAAESVLLTTLGVLAGMAGRNLATTALIAAPLLANALQFSALGPGRGRAGIVESRALLPLSAGLAVFLTAGTVAVQQPAQSSATTDMIARLVCDRLRSDRRPLVLATAYNEIGTSLFAARRAPCPGAESIRVPIDGRADRYPAGTIESWLDLTQASDGWRQTLAASAANMAVLPDDAPLAGALQSDGWLIVDHGNEHIALVAPEDT
ncbi:MAG: hypothetical protein QG671_2166, partial [Actinomycetota bacterium]|nr:hypothetical protein [Actinomycetota bacterium]